MMHRYEARRGPARHPAVRRTILATLALLGACAGPSPDRLNDDQKVVRATLALLAEGGPVCVDRTTRGDSLFAYREMLRAPRPSRARLVWHRPEPLRPPAALTDRDMARDQFRNERIRIKEPDVDVAVLPIEQQVMLNDGAQRLLQTVDAAPHVSIGSAWVPPGVTPRWWGFNRVRSDCRPSYILAPPVRTPTLAYIAVSADHWATIYAFRRAGAEWTPAGRWSSWLY